MSFLLIKFVRKTEQPKQFNIEIKRVDRDGTCGSLKGDMCHSLKD